MLNIPEQVKSLFNRDDIRKNIRITFPQSGRPDITNDNIAAETLSFTESVCSQSTFKYGLAESSVIEFETVGIDNMLGETIEAYIEIDATTLPEGMQTMRDDLTFPVYPVPLGRFVVTACPRNHEAMAHRKVRAMSQIGTNDIITTNDRAFLQKKYPSPIANMGLIFRKNLNYISIASHWGEEPDETEIVTMSSATPNSAISKWMFINQLRNGYTGERIKLFRKYENLDLRAYVSTPRLQRVQLNNLQAVSTEEIIKQLASEIKKTYPVQLEYDPGDGNWQTATIEDIENAVIKATADRTDLHLTPIEWTFSYWVSPHTPFDYGQFVYVPEPTEWITLPAAKKGTTDQATITSDVRINWSFSVVENPEEYQIINGFIVTGENPNIKAQYYYPPSTALDAVKKLEIVLQTQPTGETLDNGWKYIGFTDDKIMQEATLAYLELEGAFGNFGRTGNKHKKRLETEPAMQLTRAQYETAWWDEYDLAPVGAIAYKLGSNDMIYKFGEGASVYNLNCDKFFETLGITSDTTINEILDVALVPELQKLMYTPVEIDAHGLPYLEAGDCIELEALDGTIVKTYVLQRNLTGIQYLTDQITADGITIAEVDV